MAQDPNLSVVSLVAQALGPLNAEFMLVGGCAVGLLITDRGRPPVRQTIDVDLVAEVTSLTGYYASLGLRRTHVLNVEPRRTKHAAGAAPPRADSRPETSCARCAPGPAGTPRHTSRQ